MRCHQVPVLEARFLQVLGGIYSKSEHIVINIDKVLLVSHLVEPRGFEPRSEEDSLAAPTV